MIPHDPAFDNSLALLREGYPFIARRCARYRSDAFATRLMLTPVVCMLGREAAELFYRPDAFTRRGAMPQSSFTLIQDNGSVMVLDGDAHRRRKAMFLSLMSRPALDRLARATGAHWRLRAERWARMEHVELFREAHVALCSAVCDWAGLPLTEAEAERRADEFIAMQEGTGSVGPRNWRAHVLRGRTERWLRGVIRDIRAGRRAVPDASAAAVIAAHRDETGRLLSPKIAAVELINVLRPSIADARYIVFAAIALHRRPGCREVLQGGGDAELEAFAHEVRRFFPFIPFIGGRALAPVDWRGHRFAPGDWVLMDLYGTNHDPRLWDAPERFRPERFRNWRGDPFSLIASGGGEHARGHRCPGEWITVDHIKIGATLLAKEMHYRVPPQDLTIDLARIPAIPRSRFVMTDVRV